MKRLHKSIRRATAMVLAASMILSMLPAAVASEEGLSAQPLTLAEEEYEEEGDGEPIIQPLDPEEGGAVILPEVPADEEPTDFPVVLPTLPGEEPDIPSEGGTTVITWPDPNDGESSTEPGTDEDTGVDTGDVVDDPANIPVILPSFPDEEPDGGKTGGVCADLITEVEDTGTTVITWPNVGADVATQAAHEHAWTESIHLPATCENDGYIIYTCPGYDITIGKKTIHIYCTHKTDTLTKLGHEWGDWVVSQEYPCVAGTKTRTCNRDASHTETAEAAPTQSHSYEWVEIKKPSCTEAGEEVQVCSVCKQQGETRAKAALGGEHELTHIVEAQTCTADGKEYDKCNKCEYTYNEVTLPKLGHKWDSGTVEQEHPCVSGIKTSHCVNGSCTETKTDVVDPSEDHIAGTWTDTDQPGCCEQVFETSCTVCGGKMTKTSPAIRKHNYNSVTLDGLSTVFVCDYCGDTKSTGDWKDSALAGSAELGASALAANATDIIQEVLKSTQADVNAAETREEVIDALAGLHQKLVDQLVEKVKVTVNDTEIGLTEGMAKSLLESLGVTAVLEDVQKEAGDSFLSKESLQVTVSKIVDTVVSEDGTAATKKSAHDALFTMLYSNSEELNPEYDSSVSGLILQLAQTAANEDTDWDALTKNLLNDLLNEALDEVRSDKVSSSIGNAVADALKDALPGGLLKLWFSDVMGGVTTDVYRAYTSDEQFEELFNEVGDLVRAQIVEDPEFVNEVRKIIETAAAHAKEGVDKGWSEEKIYTNLRNDLNGVSGLVTSKIESLGTDAGDFAEGKVDSTVQKLLLSGKLGSWLGDKLGSATKDLVNDVIEKESKSIANTIDSYIKYYTCFDHDWQSVEVRSATCTSAAMTSDQCTKCGWRKSSKTEVGSPLGHEIVYDDPIEANEYAGGLTGGSHCSRCGAVLQAQQSIPRLMPTIYSDSEYHRGITEADAAALGYASLEELNAALDAAVREAGFDPANSIRFTAQVNSSIGILPNDRFPSDGTEILLPFPSDPAKEYYAVQVFAADTVLHTTGELLTTRVKKYANSIGLDLYSQAIVIVAWN